MVRVISVHHFESQLIQTCDEPIAVATAPPDRLLLALPQHAIEVRDIASNGETLFSFPTVDQVRYLEHSATGNYVVTLERKEGRGGADVVTTTRVYTNWERRCEGPMRARIAGRVTPTSSQTGGDALEMIELPNKFPSTSHIALSQATGNILVCHEKWLCLYQLVKRTHDISRLRFLDFEAWPVTLELSFAPARLRMVEDLVAASDLVSLHVFRLNKGFARATDWNSSSAQNSPHNTKNKNRVNSNKTEKAEPKKETEREPVDLEALLCEVSDVSRGRREESRLANPSNLPVLALLPGVQSSLATSPARNLRVSPFKPPHSITMGVAIKEVPANEPWAEKMTTMVESLLQLEVGGVAGEPPPELFTSLTLRPLYSNTHRQSSSSSSSSSASENSCPRLRSANYCRLVGFNCLISTQQEGYLYHFPVEDGDVMSLGRCISVYSFTSSVKHVCLEPGLLHALTTTGLETYTMRAVHAVFENDQDACPGVEEPVCLIGLRPFIGAVDLLLTEAHLVIISSPADSSHRGERSLERTVYMLRTPSLETLYREMLNVGAPHRLSSGPTYLHLLSEAHALLRFANRLSTDPTGRPTPAQVQLYKESCALFSDYYLAGESEEDWENGYKYAKMAQLTPLQVMDRVKKLESDAKESGVEVKVKGGTCHYLTRCLKESEEESQGLPPGALSTLLDLVELESGDSHTFILSSLVLQSPLLRQFSTERSIRIISQHVQKSEEEKNCVDSLAVAVLHLTRDRSTEAREALATLGPPMEHLYQPLADTLLHYWPLLFDNTKQPEKVTEWDWESVTLSEVAGLLMEDRPRELASTLAALVTSKHLLQLENVLQVFLTYLPSRCGSSSVSHVLQIFLEAVFTQWSQHDPQFSPHPTLTEPLKILMRSYLSDLVSKGEREEWSAELKEPMFGAVRPSFLESMPQHSPLPNYKRCSLLKLQCLLRSGWLDETGVSELVQFVQECVSPELGSTLLVLAQPAQALDIIINTAPQALPRYAQEMLSCEAEWRHLISTVQSKADEEAATSETDTRIYSQILEEVLDGLAHTLSCDVLSRVLPPGEEYHSYLLTCQRVAHANHILSVIMATGHRLIATLNL